MANLWQRIRDSWRRSGKQLEANEIENARFAHEAAEREKHRETELPPGRTNTDWTYIPPAWLALLASVRSWTGRRSPRLL